MAAHVVLISEEEWPIIQKFLARCQDAAIVLSPAAQKKLDRWGHPVLVQDEDEPIDYTWDAPQIFLYVPSEEEADIEIFNEQWPVEDVHLIKPGDTVHWADPADGECSRTQKVTDVRHSLVHDMCCITWADGGETEALYQELKVIQAA